MRCPVKKVNRVWYNIFMTQIPRLGSGNKPKIEIDTSAIPPTDVLKELGVDATETDRFIKAFNFVVAQMAGMNAKDAAKASEISYNTIWRDEWQRLFGIARRVVIGTSIINVQAVSAKVFEEWPSIVDSLIETAKSAPFHRDRIAAAELIHRMYIEHANFAPDTSAAHDYLKEQPNFSPMAPLQMIVESGATVNINGPAPSEPPLPPLDVTPLSEDDAAASST